MIHNTNEKTFHNKTKIRKAQHVSKEHGLSLSGTDKTCYSFEIESKSTTLPSK